ncbi:MAG TPA: hypothetical protein VEJ23_06600 [Solirubrobacteraceae bacterium]|nr:hypothetical protein [Solirubrobacteraceae bacterium]
MTDPTPRKEAEIVELVRSIDVRAPESLHRRVQELVADHTTDAARRRGLRRRGGRPAGGARPATARLAALGALAAAAIAVLVIALTSGSQTLSLREASALTLSPATAAAPRESPAGNELEADVEGIAFPYWEDRFGWRSTGMRTDRIAGRSVSTVYYADDGRRIGYAIVGGTGAPQVGKGTVARRGGHSYTITNVEGRPVVSWIRDGHLCVLSGRGVASSTLLALASSSDPNSLAY